MHGSIKQTYKSRMLLFQVAVQNMRYPGGLAKHGVRKYIQNFQLNAEKNPTPR